jgi:hypothetical protein
MDARPSLLITHVAGHMFVTDRTDDAPPMTFPSPAGHH